MRPHPTCSTDCGEAPATRRCRIGDGPVTGMAMTAAEGWAAALARWRLPGEALAAATASPYGWTPDLVGRMRVAGGAADAAVPAILDRVQAPATLLDVGAGAGRLSIPIAGRGLRVTAVEPDAAMADALAADAAARGLDIRIIRAPWPDAAPVAGRHDAALSAHVVYDVSGIGAFITALEGAARRLVVIECTPHHPWAPLIPYFRALHGFDPSAGPSADDLCRVVEETTGTRPHLERRVEAAGSRFADLQELLAFYRRRLAVPVERAGELADLLAPDVVERDGWMTLGDPVRTVCTVWWEPQRSER